MFEQYIRVHLLTVAVAFHGQHFCSSSILECIFFLQLSLFMLSIFLFMNISKDSHFVENCLELIRIVVNDKVVSIERIHPFKASNLSVYLKLIFCRFPLGL